MIEMAVLVKQARVRGKSRTYTRQLVSIAGTAGFPSAPGRTHLRLRRRSAAESAAA